MRDGFNDNRRDIPHVVRGSWLNKAARSLNAQDFERPGGYFQTGFQGHLSGASVAPPMIVGIAVITSHADTCAAATTEKEPADAPCRSEFLYTCRLRYYDYDAEIWQEYNEEFDLDASWARDLSSDFSVDLPAMPPLKAGDLVVVGFDEQRGRLVPIFRPTPTLVALTPNNGIDGRCGVEVSTADVLIFKIDNDLDPTAGGNHNLQPVVDADGNAVTRKCANLGVEPIPGNCLVLVHQETVSGTYFVSECGGSGKLYKGRARGCHHPGGSQTYDLLQYDNTTEGFETTGRIVTVHDPDFANFVLPGETIWIIQGDGATGGCGINECGAAQNPNNTNIQRPWFTLGSFGLTRMAVAAYDIGCGSFGPAVIWKNTSSGSCANATSKCQITVCNTWGFTRIITKDEQFKVKFFERQWVPVDDVQPVHAFVTLDSTLASSDATTAVTIDRFMDRCSDEVITTAHNDLGYSGISGDQVLVARDQTAAVVGNNRWQIVAAKRKAGILLAKTDAFGITGFDGTTLGTGNVDVYKRDTTDDSLALTGENFVVYNVHGAIRASTFVFVVQDGSSDDWYVLEPMMPIIQGQQVGALLSTDATNNLDNLAHLAGYGVDITDATTTVTADNDFSWDADDNALTYAFLDANGNWKMFQLTCPA